MSKCRKGLGLAPALAVLLTLGACETTPSGQQALPEKTSSSSEGYSETVSRTSDIPTQRPPRQRAGPDLNTLIGRSEADVAEMLGTPAEVRNEPPAMIWQYASDRCRLELAFYFDVSNQDFRALSYKLQPDGAKRDGQDACIASIKNGRPANRKASN